MDSYSLCCDEDEQISGSWLLPTHGFYKLTKKNKYQSRQIAKKFNNRHRSNNYHSLRSSLRRKLPPHREDVAASYNLHKAARSEHHTVKALFHQISQEMSSDIEYIHRTKSEHWRCIKERLESFLKRKTHKSYQQNHSGRPQTKQRRTINVRKSTPSTTRSSPKKREKRVKCRFEEKMFRNRYSLRIKCNILFTHDDAENAKSMHSIYQVMKCEISIFDRSKRSYWSGFSFIPAIKVRGTATGTTFTDTRQFKVRDDLKVRISNASDMTEDDNFIFYYIAQYCYECRTPYIEYECRINRALKNPVWKLGDVHLYNKHRNKFILNYRIRDILQSHRTLLRDDIVLCDDVLVTICSFLGYSSLGMTVLDGLCEYDIDDRENHIRDELVFWKQYKPPYANGDVITDLYGEQLKCDQMHKRLRVRKSNGIENWNYKLWRNVPCSMHSVLYGPVKYIDDKSGEQQSKPGRQAKYDKLAWERGTEKWPWATFGPHWWKY